MFVLLSLIFWGTNGKLYAQTTWTGTVNTVWSNAANWTAGIPTASVEAIIPNVTNDPVISVAGAIAKSVTIQTDALLTINTGASLSMNGSAVQAMANDGTVQNNGTITIGNTSTVGTYGLVNNSIFNNNTGSVLNIDRVTGDESFAIFSSAAGELLNQGTINIGKNTGAGSVGIGPRGQVTNSATGKIYIDRVSETAIYRIKLDNLGEITIGSIATGNTIKEAFEILSEITNRAGARINIDRVNIGLLFGQGYNLINSGTITIGKLTAVANSSAIIKGTVAPGEFVNNPGGIFEASGNMQGRYDDSGGTISPGTTAGAGGRLNFPSFNTYFGKGILRMDVNSTGTAGVAYDQIIVQENLSLGGTLALSVTHTPTPGDRVILLTASAISGTFATVTGLPTGWNLTYTATQVILSYGQLGQTTWTGAVDADWHKAGNWSSGIPGDKSEVFVPNVARSPIISAGNGLALSLTVQTGATLTINASRKLTIDKSFEYGLINKGTLNNNGDIVVGLTGDINLTAVRNEGTFNNNAGSTLLINRAAVFGSALFNLGTFNNGGLIRIGNSSGTPLYGLDNAGTFKNLPTGSVYIDRTTISAIYIGTNTDLYNEGEIVIGENLAAGIDGISCYGRFTSEIGSKLRIDRVTNAAFNHQIGTIRNYGDIIIGAVSGGNTMNYGVYGNSQIEFAKGTINIDRVNTAIYLASGTSRSSAKIIIGSSTNVPVLLSGGSGSFTNLPDGLLKGSGLITLNQFRANAGGTIEPGVPIGKITVEGNLALNSTAVIPMDINGVVDHDQIEATATATLNGQLNLTFNYSPQTGDRITIVKAGTLAGSFTSISALPAGWQMLYENNAMILHYYASGKTTWTGAVNTNWNTPGNWTNGLPTESAIAIIPDVNNDPTISTSTAIAGSVIVSAGVVLTITSTGVLTLNKAYSPGIQNDGQLQNNGTITIGATLASYTGISNAGKFYNNAGAKINIDHTTTQGILNLADSFYNAGTINIGANASAGQNGVVDEANFENLDGGLINIDRVSNAGIYGNDSHFTNQAGTITIGAKTGGNTLTYGVYLTKSALSNTASGVIQIDRAQTGIFVSLSSFTNRGVTALGTSTNLVNLLQGNNPGSFYNYSGGELKASGTIPSDFFVNDQGKISPGFPNGKITFTGAEEVKNGTVAIDVNGVSAASVDYDQIALSETITLSGTLALTINYAGQAAERIPIITSRFVYGTFATVTGLAPNWSVVYSDTEVALLYTHQTSWTGAVNTDWNTIGNWTAGVPATGVHALIPNVSNKPVINTPNAVANSIAVQTGGQLTVSPTGTLTLDLSVSHALLNKGSLDNHGTISIGSVAAVNGYGIRNEATFNNHTGGKIQIDQTKSTALSNNSGVFSNTGDIRIGANAASGSYGISNSNQGIFTNTANGRLFIDRVTILGISQNGIAFTNQGAITIGALSAGNTISFGIYAQWDFNNAAGQINIDRVSNAIVADSRTFTNTGVMNIGASTTVPSILSSDGTGTFSNDTGGQIKGKNNISAARFVSNGGKISPGNSPGQMTFDDSEDFSKGIVDIEVNGTGTPGVNFDQIVVNGTATLGGTLNVSVGYSWTQGDKITILSAQGISGTFSTVTGLPSSWEVGYTANAVTLTAISPLPVTLVTFNVKAHGTAAELQWRTTSETDNKGFFVQRSNDAMRWSDIGFIDGNATTSQNHDYIFRDETPGKGINYYRLRQIDFDGKTEYSRIVGIRFDLPTNEVTVWVDANRNMQIQTADNLELVTIVDLSGRFLMSSSKTGLNLSGIPAGILLVRIRTDQGTVTKKIVLD